MIQDWLNIDWDQFHFLRPEFLYLIIGVLVILVIGLFSFRDEEKWKKSIAKHLRPYVIQKGSVRFRRIMHILMSFALAIGCVGLAGPTWSEEEVPGQILETPVVIALDMSQSMMASDIQPNRLERAKFKIMDLLEANPRARVALIGFAGTAHTVVPLCQDYNIIKSHVNSLSPDLLPFQGTDIEATLFLTDSITKITEAPSQLVLMTDDINDELFRLLQIYSTREGKFVELIPMNTLSGAEVPNKRGRGAMKDANGEVVYSKLDTKVLSKIESLENVHVNRLTLDNSDVEHMANLISGKLNFQEQSDVQENNWQDRGWLLIVPLVIFMLAWFRKGFVVYGFLMLFTLNSCSDESNFQDLWYTKDYQGQQLENEGRYQEAGDMYEDPMRSGVAYYKAGDYESAVEEFSKD
ncbi:MAG: VWA domain-containing protein, partial [Schleiferiaceae bacterium]|nr:VWA domain-containing protein [Schleiferiaceae bacterium]